MNAILYEIRKLQIIGNAMILWNNIAAIRVIFKGKKRIQTPPVQAESSIPITPLTIRSKRSTVRVVQDDLIHHQLQSELLTAQKAFHKFDASSSKLISTNSVLPPIPGKNIFQQPDPSSPLPKQKRTQTVLGQALEQEEKLKQTKINAQKEKYSMK